MTPYRLPLSARLIMALTGFPAARALRIRSILARHAAALIFGPPWLAIGIIGGTAANLALVAALWSN
jgi:hypothetical protein